MRWNDPCFPPLSSTTAFGYPLGCSARVKRLGRACNTRGERDFGSWILVLEGDTLVEESHLTRLEELAYALEVTPRATSRVASMYCMGPRREPLGVSPRSTRRPHLSLIIASMGAEGGRSWEIAAMCRASRQSGWALGPGLGYQRSLHATRRWQWRSMAGAEGSMPTSSARRLINLLPRAR